jgi:hypothetical protein
MWLAFRIFVAGIIVYLYWLDSCIRTPSSVIDVVELVIVRVRSLSNEIDLREG